MKKIKVLFWLGIAIGLMMVIGCAMDLETQMKKAGQTDLNDIYATAARVRNPLGQEAIAIEIHAEARQPELAYRRTTVTTPAAESQAAPPAEMPKDLKSAKLRWVPPSQPCTPPKQPALPQVVVDEEGYYPSTTPLATAGGTGAGFLQTWGNALLGNAPMALGVWGAAKVLKPAQTSVSQTGGGASTGTITSTGGTAFQTQGQVSNNRLVGINSNNTPTNIGINNRATGTGIGTGVGVGVGN